MKNMRKKREKNISQTKRFNTDNNRDKEKEKIHKKQHKQDDFLILQCRVLESVAIKRLPKQEGIEPNQSELDWSEFTPKTKTEVDGQLGHLTVRPGMQV